MFTWTELKASTEAGCRSIHAAPAVPESLPVAHPQAQSREATNLAGFESHRSKVKMSVREATRSHCRTCALANPMGHWLPNSDRLGSNKQYGSSGKRSNRERNHATGGAVSAL